MTTFSTVTQTISV